MFYGFLQFGCIPISNSLQVLHKVLSLNRLQICLSREWDFQHLQPVGINQVGFSLSWWSGVLHDGDHVRLLVAGGKNCKVDTSQNHQNGICLKSVMLSNKNIRICHRYRHPEIFGVSFFNTRRRPPLSDPYLPTIDELIWVQINSGSWKKVTHLTQAKRRFARHGDLFMKPWWYIPYSMLQVCHIYLQCGLNLW